MERGDTSHHHAMEEKVDLMEMDETRDDNMMGQCEDDEVTNSTIPVGQPLVPAPRNIVYHSMMEQIGRIGTRQGYLQPSNYKLDTEKLKARQLLSSRVEKWSGVQDDEVEPIPLPLPLNANIMDTTNHWIKFENGPSLKQIGGAKNLIWTNSLKSRDANGTKLYEEQFYILPPPLYHFMEVEKRESQGLIALTSVLKTQGPRPNEASEFLVTVDTANVLKAFDLEKKSTTIELQLNKVIKDGKIFQFNEFVVRNEEREILVFGRNKKGKVKAIIILNFPPWWNSVSVIYIDDSLNINVKVQEEYCFIEHGIVSKLLVTAWKSLLETAKLTTLKTSTSGSDQIEIEGEYVLSKLPTHILQISKPLKTKFDFYNFVTPMIHINCGILGHQLFPIFPTSKNGKRQKPIRLDSIEEYLGDQDSIVIPFPDGSQRLLVSNPDDYVNREMVLTFTKSEENEIVYKQSFPFLDDTSDDDEDDISKDGNSRNPNQCVLAMNYCAKLDVFAVLFAEGDTFQVKMYDAPTLRFFLALPIIFRHRTTRHNVSDIDKASLYCQHEFIMINMAFKNSSVKEFYFCKLMPLERS